uniref:Uncharacterized protein n=1 Tax=Oryza punctata TaxID=4537 RepID=A0A0E0KDX5_ORYPU
MDELENALPSDFASLIDVRYKDQALYSEVIWGIPNSGGATGWFYNCPFRIDLFDHSTDDENNGSNGGEVLLPITDSALPWLPSSMEQERRDREAVEGAENDGVKLSWIVVNRKLKRAVNLAELAPSGRAEALADRRRLRPPVRLGSSGQGGPAAVPGSRSSASVLLAKFQVTTMASEVTREPLPVALALTELSMQVEEMCGRSLLVLKEALGCCHRSRNLEESCHSRVWLKPNMYMRAATIWGIPKNMQQQLLAENLDRNEMVRHIRRKSFEGRRIPSFILNENTSNQEEGWKCHFSPVTAQHHWTHAHKAIAPVFSSRREDSNHTRSIKPNHIICRSHHPAPSDEAPIWKRLSIRLAARARGHGSHQPEIGKADSRHPTPTGSLISCQSPPPPQRGRERIES